MKPIKKIYWFLKALLANCIYGFPSRNIILIGVTGTDGKTSTTSALYHALKKMGEKASYISTVNAVIGGEEYALGFHVTTPSPFFIQKSIAKAVKKNEKYVILETTSHAIDQLRVWGCSFRVGIITNITSEHLDYHKTLSNYGRTKISLLNGASIGIVNADNPTHYLFKKNIKNKNVWYTSVQKKADYTYADLTKDGYTGRCDGFQCENILLAYATLVTLGFDRKKVAQVLGSIPPVIGRLQYIEKKNRRFIVDFAHTPNAFKRLYEYIPTHWGYGRLIHVFGCAGERDKKKRIPMGQYAARFADEIIITEEDFRTERIDNIYKEIQKGIVREKRNVIHILIPNRQDAITEAVRRAGPMDIILLTGKAHEKSLCRGKTEYPWDEFKAIDKALDVL